MLLDVYGRVTSISPSTGSRYGGALVTITGENFSYDPLDNPVMIGDHYCYVQTSSPTEITCRTDLLTDQLVGEETFIVFLKTSEEAGTPNGDDIMFTYVEPSANVTDVQVEFSDFDFSHKVIVTGTGFDSQMSLMIDGYEQSLDSQDSTTATFTMTNIDAMSSMNV